MKRNTNTIYTVTYGMPGYLPNSVSYFTSKRAAQEYARDLANEARANGDRVTGNMKTGYSVMPEGASDYNTGSVIEMDSHDRSFLDTDNASMSTAELVDYLNSMG